MFRHKGKGVFAGRAGPRSSLVDCRAVWLQERASVVDKLAEEGKSQLLTHIGALTFTSSNLRRTSNSLVSAENVCTQLKFNDLRCYKLIVFITNEYASNIELYYSVVLIYV